MNEHISKIINHPQRVPIGIGVAVVIGGGVGYFLYRRKKRAESADSEQLEMNFDVAETWDEIKSARQPVVIDEEVYIQRGAQFVEEHLQGTEVDLAIIDEGTENETILVAGGTLVLDNVFAGNDEDWNYQEELAKRTTTEPYVIHKDEFYATENDYSQVTLTYYAGDNMLVDENDAPVYNYETIIGPFRFGHGSGDPNVFYVRNDKNEAEYEVCQDPGLYAVEVLGSDIEDVTRAADLKHSAAPARFRDN